MTPAGESGSGVITKRFVQCSNKLAAGDAARGKNGAQGVARLNVQLDLRSKRLGSYVWSGRYFRSLNLTTRFSGGACWE